MTDDNKTTPTPAPGLDLDAVEAAERAMTPGEWRHGSVERHHVFCSEGDRSLLCPEAGRVLLRMNEHFPHDSDAAGIVALRNAAPALIAEVRALRAEVAAAKWPKLRAEIARLTAELDAARAEVNCGQDGPCVKAPGCARHWQERNRELADELAAARAVPADVEAAIGLVDAIVEHVRTLDSYDWQSRLDDSRTSDDAKDDARELSHALRDYDRSNGSTFLRTAIARAISEAEQRAVGDFLDRAKTLSTGAGTGKSPVEAAILDYRNAVADWEHDDPISGSGKDAERRQCDAYIALLAAISDDATAARGTVGGLLATAPVDLSGPAGSRWTNAIEWVDGETWFRIATGASADGSPTLVLSTWCDGGWGYEDENPMSIDACVYALPARLVPAAEADADPSQRGPLPKGG